MLEADEGDGVSEIEEAEAINQSLDSILDMMREAIDQHPHPRTPAEVLVTARQDFVNLAYQNLAFGAGTAIICDYVSLGASLLRLLENRKRIAELEDAVAMRDACLKNLGAWEDGL